MYLTYHKHFTYYRNILTELIFYVSNSYPTFIRYPGRLIITLDYVSREELSLNKTSCFIDISTITELALNTKLLCNKGEFLYVSG